MHGAEAWFVACLLGSDFANIVKLSRKDEMELLSELFARRWPYMLFVFIGAALSLIFVLFLSTAPFLVILVCLNLYAALWASILKARFAAVGLPHSRWVICLYGLFVYIACVLLSYLFTKGRFFFPVLFVLLNMPQIVLNDKPQVQN